jgi:general secretion pathway protein G
MKRRISERHIFFPWERRGGMWRRIRLDQVRPLLAVLGIFGVLFLVGLRERRASGVRRTRATLLRVRESVDSYMADHDGGCPSAGLSGLGDYAASEGPPSDAWGKGLRLRCPGRDRSRYDLSSDGPDGVPGGLDRIQ